VLGPRDRDELAVANIPSLAPIVTYLEDKNLLKTDLVPTAKALTRRLHAVVDRWWFHLDLDVLATESFSAIRYRSQADSHCRNSNRLPWRHCKRRVWLAGTLPSITRISTLRAAGRPAWSPFWKGCSTNSPDGTCGSDVSCRCALNEEAEHQIDEEKLQRGGGEIPTRPTPQSERDCPEHQSQRPAPGERKHQALRQG
jgi:hypothetical protein